MPREGRESPGPSLKINRRDPSRKVVDEAEKILHDIRGKAQYLVPFRMLHHLPDHDSIIRPVDTVRVTFIGTGMSTSGFRRHEPCCTNDPIPEFGLRRFVIGGNHRYASTRDSGQVLVPTNRISSKQLRALMRMLKEEDEVLIRAGVLGSHYPKNQQALRCLEILAISLQGLEPAPKPLSCLQQVQVIRTAARNDPALDFVNTGTASYGGVTGLRKRIFSRHSGTDDSSIHFLLNNKMSQRHKNKLLAGAKVLIATKNAFQIPALAHKTSLDVLIHWESKGRMGTFLDTHLSYIGPLATTALHSIMKDTHDCITDGNYRTTPFNTNAFRLHVGATGTKRKATKKQQSSPRALKKAKRAPVKSKANTRRAANTTGKKGAKADTDDGVDKDAVNTVGDTAASKSAEGEKAVEETPVVSQSPARTDSDPKENAPTPPNNALPESPKAKGDISPGISKPNEASTIESHLAKELRAAKEKAALSAKEVDELRKALDEEKEKAAADTRAALEKERALLKDKYNEEIQNASKKAKIDTTDESKVESLEARLRDLEKEKEKEIADLKSSFELERKRALERSVNNYKKENEALRRRLKELEASSSAPVREEDITALRQERDKIKKELDDLKRSASSSRRLGRAVVPSDKFIANMSAEARRELRKKLERFERENDES